MTFRCTGSTMVYTKQELNKACNNFEPENLIGKGGSGLSTRAVSGCAMLLLRCSLRYTLATTYTVYRVLSKYYNLYCGMLFVYCFHVFSVQRGVTLLRATTESQMRTEVNTLSHFRHPNILPLMGYCTQPPCLVYPLMARRSLFVNLHEFRTIKVKDYPM